MTRYRRRVKQRNDILNIMSKKFKSLSLRLALLAVVTVLMFSAGGCIGLGGGQAGWSGVVVDDGSLYFGSSGGKLIKKNAESGAQIWFREFKKTSSGNILGCGGGTTAIPIYGTPAVEGEMVYVATFGGDISAFSTEGASIWEYPGENGTLGAFLGGPVVYNGKLYAAAVNGTVYALDSTSGTLLWETQLKEDVWASPSIDNGILYIGTYDKKVYALDAESGQAVWQQPFEADGPITAAPLTDNGIVYIASLDRHIYALDAASGELVWKFPQQTEGNDENTPKKWFWASPVLHYDIIYAANMDGNIYVLNTADGSLITVIELEDAVAATSVVAGDKLFVATEKGNLFIIDTADNSKLKMPALEGKVNAPLTSSDGVVYIHTIQDEIIYAINAETGVTLWSDDITSG